MTKEELLNKLDDLIGEVILGKTELNKDCFDLFDMITLVHFCFFFGIDDLMIKNNLFLLNTYYSVLKTYELIDKGVDKQEAMKKILSKELFNSDLIDIDKSKLN